jgi:type VI secretion system protein ImpM
MQCGIFGKLPAKRDFVSYNIPRPFLNGWESWLQAAIADSRHAMGDNWVHVFLTQPIWRFWCGPGVFGQAAAGAIMPSVDGVGRYFPLSICAVETDNEWPAPPDASEEDAWYRACENALLEQLQDGAEFEANRVLQSVGLPTGFSPKLNRHEQVSIQIWPEDAETLHSAFVKLSDSDRMNLSYHRGIWWTAGGDNNPAQLITTHGPIQPSLWTTFMTGLVTI